MMRGQTAALCVVLAWPGAMALGQTYVGSEVCAECHMEETEAWSRSHHALAWTEVGPDTLGDFDNTQFTHKGMALRFRLEDGHPHVSVTEKDGETTDYPIHSVAGIAPLQQYLLETEPGRLQSFDVVWDVEEARWYHLYPDQDLPPDDGLHWTGPYKSWNARCAECHATGYRRNYDLTTRSYAPEQAEIGVGCEACHGPASRHLAWLDGDEVGGDEIGGTDLDSFGFPMSFGQGDTAAEIEQCAGCHARRESLGDGNPRPGTAFHEAYNLALLRPDLYHADGQILEEVYVYGSFLQSKMYARGVGCSDCHEPHSGDLVAEGNAVCTQCHSPAGNPDFPTLRRAVYDDPSHTFHAPETEGANCRNCHMIERAYMGIDWRRDHSFRVPRPDVGQTIGAPDACTDCHTDQTQAWASAEIAQRFPESQHRGPHYGEVLARGRQDPGAVAGDLAALAVDPDQAGIVRATAAYLLEPVGSVEVAMTLAQDPDPLVRASAAGLLRGLPPQERAQILIGLFTDPVRNVRVEAFRKSIDLAGADLRPSQRAALTEAQRDWQLAMQSRMDFPEAHLIMAGAALTLRNFPAARQAFREAVTLDPQRVEAWSMLVRLAEALDGRAAAREVLEEALDAAGPAGDLMQLHQSLWQ